MVKRGSLCGYQRFEQRLPQAEVTFLTNDVFPVIRHSDFVISSASPCVLTGHVAAELPCIREEVCHFDRVFLQKKNAFGNRILSVKHALAYC